MSVAEIEAAIQTLGKDDLAQFDQWYRDFLDNQWDEQIRRDVSDGKLDFLLEEVKREREAGTLKPYA